MNKPSERTGVLALTGCMLLWGFLPIYWRALIPISSGTIIIYRIFLVCVSAILLAKTRYSWGEIFGPLMDRKTALKFFLAGALITANWSTYIWAVNAGFVIQSSLGYYIEPLVICVFGVVIFREKMTRWRGIAVGMATAAILLQLWHLHQIPGIALGLASTFAVYAAVKKTVSLPPLISLVYETIFFAPIALGVLIWMEATGRGALAVAQPYQYVLLLFCGLLTVTPLALFAWAAQLIPLFTIGLMEYISPTISMFLGIFLFHEPFDGMQLLTFAIIWVGLVFFTIGEYRTGR